MSSGDYICPLEWRYGSQEMRKLFTRSNIVKRMLDVEVALAYGLAAAGIMPLDYAKKIEESSTRVNADDIYELERRIGHDVMALATLLAEASGEAGRYVHLGATSNDIIDTAWALILRDAINILKNKLREVIYILIEYSRKYRETLMPGRTHGQHALPITLGFKFANYVYELARSLERIRESEKRVIRGKIAGAVGTMAAWRDKGLIVERKTLQRLGLEPHIISTQVAPRDSFAELASIIAILGGQLDRLATEVRELMRPEIMELAEGTSKRRVGSSTMPHKKNPVTAEKISGLARVLRGLVITALENIPLWHERDLTNSSSERILIPHLFLVIDEMLSATISLLQNLEVYEANMLRNLELTKGEILSEAVMIALVHKGLPRHKAHELLRTITASATDFRKALLENPEILSYLSREELVNLLEPRNYLGMYRELIERSIKYAEAVMSEKDRS